VAEEGSVVPLVLTSLAIMGSPGPATISLTAAGAAFGVRRSVGYLLGIIAGTVAVLVAVATGVTAVLLSFPAVRPVVIGVSAAYILWLAYHLATASPQTQTKDAHAPSLVGGALLGVANPKAWVAIAAVFASARLAQTATVDAAAKAGVLAAMIVLINTVWLVAGASFAPVLREPRRARIVNVVLAVTLIAATAVAIVV
jgi:threonine/homoserine/homoserine lactone efflux protein